VLRRYKSRIAAALFALFGLIGFGFGMLILSRAGFVYIAVALVLFFGAYFAIAVWTLVALMRLHGDWSRPVFVTRLASYATRLLQRSD
jgi:hypothetical protein